MSYLEILTVQEPWLAVKQNLPLKGKQRIPASCQHDLKGECTRGNPLFPKYLSGRNWGRHHQRGCWHSRIVQEIPRQPQTYEEVIWTYFYNICYMYLSITLDKNWQHYVPWKTIRFLAYDFYIFFIKEIKKVLAMAYFELLSHQLKRTTTVLHKSRG